MCRKCVSLYYIYIYVSSFQSTRGRKEVKKESSKIKLSLSKLYNYRTVACRRSAWSHHVDNTSLIWQHRRLRSWPISQVKTIQLVYLSLIVLVSQNQSISNLLLLSLEFRRFLQASTVYTRPFYLCALVVITKILNFRYILCSKTRFFCVWDFFLSRIFRFFFCSLLCFVWTGYC